MWMWFQWSASANDGPPSAISEMTWFGCISGGSIRMLRIAFSVIVLALVAR